MTNFIKPSHLITSMYQAANNGVKSIAKCVAPALISAGIQAGLADHRIGQIIGGLGLMYTGVATMAASGVPNSIKNHLWSKRSSQFSERTFSQVQRCVSRVSNSTKNHLESKKNKPEQSSERTSSKVLRWGVAGAGLAATCLGVCSVASGVKELMWPTLSRCDQPEQWPDHAKQIKENLESCTEAREEGELMPTLPNMDHLSDWDIEIVSASKLPFGAQVRSSTSKLEISCNSPHPTASAICKVEDLLSQIHPYVKSGYHVEAVFPMDDGPESQLILQRLGRVL